VQQKQGRVNATTQMRGVSINDDESLEREADVMGARAGRSATTLDTDSPEVSAARAPAGHSPVQRRLKLEPRGLEDAAQRLKSYLKDDFAEYEPTAIFDALVKMLRSPVNFGVVNLEDKQQLELLSFQVLKVLSNEGKIDEEQESKEGLKQEEWARLKQTSRLRNIFKLAFVGKGSSVAYYINSLGKSYDHSETLIIGKPDPWVVGPERPSRGEGYIGHTKQEINPYGEKVPSYDEVLTDRPDFAAEVRTQLEAVPEHNRVDAVVKSVTKDDMTGLYVITAGNGEIYYAQKVVVGLGAGPHTQTPEVETFRREQPLSPSAKRIMDIDEFMRLIHMRQNTGRDLFRGQTVIVVGPNAGIDVAEAAGRVGFHVEWFITESGPPALLPGASVQQPFARKFAENTRVAERDSVKIHETGGTPPLRVTYKENKTKKEKEVSGDYYVYATGQSINAKGAAGQVLSGVKSELEPIYDKNLAMGDAPYKTVLGLQTRGTTAERGLEVVGASAFSLGGNVKHTYDPETAYSETFNVVYELKELMLNLVDPGSSWMHLYLNKVDQLREVAFDLWRDVVGGEAINLAAAKTKEEKCKQLAGEIRNELRGKTFTEQDVSSIVDKSGLTENRYRNLTETLRGMLSLATRKLEDLTTATVYFSKENQEALKEDIKNKMIFVRPAGTGVISEMMNQVRGQPTDIALPPQLGPMRTSIATLNAALPPYITRESNYSSDDRNMLRVFMATKYPDLKEEDAEHVMNLILSHRRTGYHPFGYRPENREGWPNWYQFFNEILASWQQYRKGR